MSSYVQKILDDVKAKNANEPEFIQAVEEVLSTLAPVLEALKYTVEIFLSQLLILMTVTKYNGDLLDLKVS